MVNKAIFKMSEITSKNSKLNKQISNYRQSRARRILVSRLRIFRQPIEASPEKV